MNLFSLAFNEVSEFDLQSFLDYTDCLMPIHLLAGALRNNQSINATCQKSIEEIHTFMCNKSQLNKTWRNPEIFYPIECLSRVSSQEEINRRILDLKTHLGLITLDEGTSIPDGYYRLIHSHDFILHVQDGQHRRLRDEAYIRFDNFQPVICLPTTALFEDMLNTNLYPDVIDLYNKDDIINTLRNAIDLLAQYSSEIFVDFQRVISSIVLTPDFKHPERCSYSCRLAYFGGIFISPFGINKYRLVEALIHEYYHHRIWQWWAYAKLEDIPSEEAKIISPITGSVKSVPVMIHALAIYISAVHFYTEQVRSIYSISTNDLEWIQNRIYKLNKGIPDLHEKLAEVVGKNGQTRRFIDFLMDNFSNWSNNLRIA